MLRLQPPAQRRKLFPNPLALSRIPLQPSTTNIRIEERALHRFRQPMHPDLCPPRKQSRISCIIRHHRALNHTKSKFDDKSYNPDTLTFSHRRILNCLVQNEPGVLSRVSGILAGRGFNIDSLVVCRTEIRDLSRMCVVISGQEAVVEQARRQLEDLVSNQPVHLQPTSPLERFPYGLSWTILRHEQSPASYSSLKCQFSVRST